MIRNVNKLLHLLKTNQEFVAAKPFSTCGVQNKTTYRMKCLKASLTLFQP